MTQYQTTCSAASDKETVAAPGINLVEDLCGKTRIGPPECQPFPNY